MIGVVAGQPRNAGSVSKAEFAIAASLSEKNEAQCRIGVEPS